MVTVRKYKNHWAVFSGEDLVAVTVYKKGAENVKKLLESSQNTPFNYSEEEEVKHTVNTVTKFINNFSCPMNLFIQAMAIEHRTLQQDFTKLCVAWLWYLSKLEEDSYDLRNEASVKLAKKLLKGMDVYDICLPTI